MQAYIPVIVSTITLAWFAQHAKTRFQKRVLYILACIGPVLMAMFRYNNGADYLMYMSMFKIYGAKGASISSFSSVKVTEIGFFLLIKICSFIFNNQYFIFYGIIALIICGFMYAGIWQQSTNVVFSVFLFYAAGTYFDSFNGLRQYIAVAIVVYALKYIYINDFKHYCVWIVLAALFHYSALIMIPFFFIRFIEIDLKTACSIVLTCLIGGKILYNIVSYILQFTRYRYFLTSVEYEIMVTQASILYTTIISLLTFGYSKIFMKSVSPKLQIMMNMQSIVWCSAVLSLSIPLAWRVQYYFLPFEILYIPCFISEIKQKNRRVFLGIFFSVMYTIITVYGIMENDWYNCVPYNFYFDNIQ